MKPRMHSRLTNDGGTGVSPGASSRKRVPWSSHEVAQATTARGECISQSGRAPRARVARAFGLTTAPSPRDCITHRRGGVLLEVLLSIAIFVGAGAFALAAMRTTFDNIDRARRDQVAVDLARSKMAELEAGLVSLSDLRGGPITDVGSLDYVDDRAGAIEWIAEVRTRRTEYRDLTLIELTVREAGADDDPRGARFTLRQLMKMRDFDPEDYEEDDLLRGLPGTE